MKRKRAVVGRPRVAYRGQIFSILEARAVYPSGTVKTFEYCRHSPTAAVLAFNHLGWLLLTREFRENIGARQWRIPGGHVDGRTPRAAAQRELREETGFRAKILTLFMRSSGGHSYTSNAYLFVAAQLMRDPLPMDEGEEIRVMPTPIVRAYRMALDGTIVNEFISLGIIRLAHVIRQAGGVKKFLRSL